MAKELRHEHLIHTGTSATADSLAEFRNDSSEMIHIRELDQQAHALAATPADEAVWEISKSPAMASRTNNNVFFVSAMLLVSNATGASAVDGSSKASKLKKYARGQLTLEPGESLYVNYLLLTGAMVVDGMCTIAYEF